MPETKEWTLMFYFASDNPLAPGIVSQLKAIKEAGFHQQANVVARFDPHTPQAPTHVFDVNLINKLKEFPNSDVGFTDNDPFVRNLVADKLWRDETASNGDAIRDRIKRSVDAVLEAKGKGLKYDPPLPPIVVLDTAKVAAATDECTAKGVQNSRANGLIKEPTPCDSLNNFLQFCCASYPARHYMLFILGHGLVVANDTFLFDDNADGEHALTLAQLSGILNGFTDCIRKKGFELDLIGFHSCSLSGLEVAYELKGTANFMLASQGPAFVGSWPYRQILIRIFNDLEKYGQRIDIKTMVTKIFQYCLYNSYDFQLAGYSFDLCLTDLRKLSDEETAASERPTRDVRLALNQLSEKLIVGLGDPLVQELILLAHWDAQSYWQENYTDLFDFCFRLNRRCAKHAETASGATATVLQDIMAACKTVAAILRRGVYGDDDKLIVRCEFAGPAYQYSRGLSIYFPWSRPIANDVWDEQYGSYALIKGPGEKTETDSVSWKTFLDAYFIRTMRNTYAYELKNPKPKDLEEPSLPSSNPDADLLEELTGHLFNESGQLGTAGSKDPVGDDCDCPSIKNYPRSTRSSPAFFDDLRFI